MISLRSAIFAGALMCACVVDAQTVPPADERDTAMPQAQTSEPIPATKPATADTPAPAAVSGATSATPESPATATDRTAEPAVSATTAPPADAKPASGSRGSFKTMDRIELESSAVTGNRELPKVLYIVPWKKADMGDLIGRPANSLIDEVLAPVDRDVFKRQLEYYSTLNGETAGAPAAAAPPH
jgi:hypothetical protein